MTVGFTATLNVVAEADEITWFQIVVPSVYWIVYGATKEASTASKVNCPVLPAQIGLPVNPPDVLFGGRFIDTVKAQVAVAPHASTDINVIVVTPLLNIALLSEVPVAGETPAPVDV